MKPIIKTTITALTIVLLSQPLFATDASNLHACFNNVENEKVVTIDVNKFSYVWLKLHNEHNEISYSQEHLQNYLDVVLDNNDDTLDVERFAHLWEKAGNRTKEDHLTKRLANMVEKSNTKDDCYQATDTRENTNK
ncbi:MAG: Unknown protein [uncultured Sulfurovum sp.]|uniref:Uncharacterized protein n=1 Tax=uncultured Sulfurovum sp. TaxID=269237 RepID=A0A6S6T0V8_9BACT|nr:MAG: Unknown protein [uncultured Sulfurovum sp.]